VSDKIISDLLNFSKEVSADKKQVSIKEIVQRTLLRFPAPKAVDIHLDLPDDQPNIYADPLQMEQILGNLIVNAIQAMNDSGQLSLTSALKEENGDKWVRIAVTDTGTGITPEKMMKLFEPLFTTKAKGIGLGLAVSKKLAEANGGWIEVESQVGKGSTFTLVLQVIRSDVVKP
jgi:signal transduction histidine kinase